MILSHKDRLTLKVQRVLNSINAFWFGPLFIIVFVLIGRYRCKNLDDTRKKVAEVYAKNSGKPVIICSNHLTMIDSMLITWFMFPLRKMCLGFRYFPWNVPEIRNFGKNLLLKAMCYLGKCVFVERNGAVGRNQRSLAKLRYLLSLKESICLFPEGGRSRSGLIDPEQCSYGVGTLMLETNIDEVLLVYLRGASQKNFSFFPKKGEEFTMSIHSHKFHTENKGKRGARDLTIQIMTELKKMEDEHFAVHS